MANFEQTRNAKILIVDDLEANVVLLERMLRGAGYQSIHTVTDSNEVFDLHRAYAFDLILLDLQMPGLDGFQVMEGLRSLEPGGCLPVLVITAQPGYKLKALEAGARDFISKPFDLAEVLARVHNILEVRLLQQELQYSNRVLEQRVRERTLEVQESHLETIFTMTRAADHRDEDTGSHVKRISYYCRDLAQWMGQDATFVDQIFFASPMHDIGKIGIHDHVLLKPGELTPDEWEVMKGHAQMGAEILGHSTSPYLMMGAEIALNHHERWNGGGYPSGKRGGEIPLSARIMSICDIYDALRSRRPYKSAFDHQKAVAIITQGDGRTVREQFEPAVLQAFTDHHQVFGEVFDRHESDLRAAKPQPPLVVEIH